MEFKINPETESASVSKLRNVILTQSISKKLKNLRLILTLIGAQKKRGQSLCGRKI